MNNQELELKVKEILSIDNFFDMMEAAIEFQKEYKNTEFYKKTKISLFDVIKNSKVWYAFNIQNIKEKIQGLIDSLSFEKINELLDQLGSVYATENQETWDILREFKSIVK